jgi:putative DNA primase/helicase
VHGCASLGFVLTIEDPFTGADLDDSIHSGTGRFHAWAAGIVRRLDSYTERSPSGTGVKVLVRGCLPPGRQIGARAHA